VTGVSIREGGRGETRPQVAGEVELQEAPRLASRPGEGTEVDLDEFETGAYLCRWPNGDFSLVTANTRRETLVQLDDWNVAHPSQLFPLEFCMVDFRLNDLGEIEFKQFGEETEDLIWAPATRSFVCFKRMMTTVGASSVSAPRFRNSACN
jgi:hypothetical protein